MARSGREWCQYGSAKTLWSGGALWWSEGLEKTAVKSFKRKKGAQSHPPSNPTAQTLGK